jgi:hypothetical protein
MPLPNSFVGKSQELFDITYMQALYKIGFELGKDPDNWSTSFQELFG